MLQVGVLCSPGPGNEPPLARPVSLTSSSYPCEASAGSHLSYGLLALPTALAVSQAKAASVRDADEENALVREGPASSKQRPSVKREAEVET